jgi:hypothetical protein
MVNFFIEGGVGMFPVLIIGLILLFVAVRYLIDTEPVRLRLVAILSLALLAAVALAVTLDVSKVLYHASGIQPERVRGIITEGLKESGRPAVLGLGLLALSLDLVAVGVYRAGRRELMAARGS